MNELGAFWGFPVRDSELLFRGEAIMLGEPPVLIRGVRDLTPHAAWISEVRAIVRDGAVAAFPDLRLPSRRLLPV